MTTNENLDQQFTEPMTGATDLGLNPNLVQSNTLPQFGPGYADDEINKLLDLITLVSANI